MKIKLFISRSAICRACLALTALCVITSSSRAVLAVAATDQQAVQQGQDTLTSQLPQFGFSAGVGVLYVFGKRPVQSATVDANNVLRVTSDSPMRAGGLLEAHFLFKGKYNESPQLADGHYVVSTDLQKGVIDRAAGAVNLEKVYDGFFNGVSVAVELGDNVIKSIGIGYIGSLYHFKVSGTGANTQIEKQSPAFNLGLYLMAQPSVKSLSPGLAENRSVAAGTPITLRDEPRAGVALIFSAGF